MLVLSSVSVRFGGLQVLDKVSLSVPECGIFGLIGPNGAGKTTVFNLVTGLLSPNSGAIEFMGQRMNGMLPHQITRSGIARTFQNIRIFKEMKLVENVLVALGARSTYAAGAWLRLTSSHDGERQDREVARALLARVGLSDKAERYAETLSYGEQRRLEIARALATQPKLLLLDEPAAGMNPVEKQVLVDEIIKLNQDGMTILIIEHDMGVIMNLCHEIAVLNFGSLIAVGPPDKIRANPKVIEAYLGPDDRSPSKLPVTS